MSAAQGWGAAARIARRELRGGIRGFRVFLLCLALGVGAIAAVGGVRAAIEDGLVREGAVLLGGDGELRLTYRFATDSQRAALDAAAAAVSEVADFRSMAVAGEGEAAERAVTQVKAVDAAWPLMGAPVLDPPLTMPEVLAGRDGRPGAAIDPRLAERLGIAPGDSFRLGTQDFVLMAHLLREPDGVAAGFSLGPRTIVATGALAGSGLLAPGALYEVSYRLLAREGQGLNQLRRAAMAGFEDAGARWRDRTRAEPAIQRFVERLGSFLVLVGLAGLAVGGVGVSSAVRAYLDGKTPVIATLKTLGATGATIFRVYFLQIAALTGLGIGAGLVLGAVVPPLVAPLFSANLPIPFSLGIYPAPLAEAALYGALTALVFTLWPLARVERVRAAALYRGLGEGNTRPRGVWALALAASVAALVGAALWFAPERLLALGAALGVAGALIVLALAAGLLRRLAARAARSRALRGRTALRLALGAVGSPREGVVAVVLSLGLGLTVLATIGQIDANLRHAIASELPARAPSYFMLDIQPDQLQGVIDRLRADPGVGEIDTAPQLRGVITSVNGRPAREFGNHWIFRGDRGVTYADALPPGTRIVEGAWWGADYTGPNLISMGLEQAREVGLGIGDTLGVNILGREITGTIANLREVDFRTGGIGFVVMFNAAALQGAPHTHLLTVHAEEAAEAAILRDISNAWPNITAIRIREAVEQAAEALGSLAAATSGAALAVLATGFVVLIGAAAAGERGRVYESAVLKTLGASRRRILASFALRSVMMGAAAGVVAIGAGALASWAVLTQVMELRYAFQPVPALLVVAGGVLAVLLAGLLFALRPLAAKPARVLRAQDG